MSNVLKHQKTIIFITGGPGTGKSYAASCLVKNLNNLTVLSYDTLKEKTWDKFGFANAEEKESLNQFSLEEYYLTLQKMMREEKTILTEYPFYQRHKDRLQSLVKKYEYRAITVFLYGNLQTIYERGKKRDLDLNRHPGHLTNCYLPGQESNQTERNQDSCLSYLEFCSQIVKKNYDIQIGTTIAIDVTDLTHVNYDQMLEQIHAIDEKPADG